MASTANYRYTDDQGNVWQVTLPVDFATVLGFPPALGGEPYLPATIAPRYVTYQSVNPLQWRQVIIPVPAIFASPPLVVAVAGVTFTYRSSIGESVPSQLFSQIAVAAGPQGPPGATGAAGTSPLPEYDEPYRQMSGWWSWSPLAYTGVWFSQANNSIRNPTYANTGAYNNTGQFTDTILDANSRFLVNVDEFIASSGSPRQASVATNNSTILATDCPNFSVWAALNSSGSTRHWIAFTNTGFTTDSPAETVGFRRSSVAGDANWQFYAKGTAGGATIIDSGIPYDPLHVHHWRLRFLNPGQQVEFSYDHTVIRTLAINAITNAMGWGVSAMDPSGGASAFCTSSRLLVTQTPMSA